VQGRRGALQDQQQLQQQPQQQQQQQQQHFQTSRASQPRSDVPPPQSDALDDFRSQHPRLRPVPSHYLPAVQQNPSLTRAPQPQLHAPFAAAAPGAYAAPIVPAAAAVSPTRSHAEAWEAKRQQRLAPTFVADAGGGGGGEGRGGGGGGGGTAWPVLSQPPLAHLAGQPVPPLPLYSLRRPFEAEREFAAEVAQAAPKLGGLSPKGSSRRILPEPQGGGMRLW
jgi:hypothetical protein